MTVFHASSEDAIEVYAFAVAFLHDAQFNCAAVAATMHIEEVAPAVFYFWRKDQRAIRGERLAPVAICSYRDASKSWRTELITGETLTLLDKGTIWEVTNEEMPRKRRSPFMARNHKGWRGNQIRR